MKVTSHFTGTVYNSAYRTSVLVTDAVGRTRSIWAD